VQLPRRTPEDFMHATPQTLQKAIQKHQNGDHRAACTLVKKWLRKNPRNPDALHLLGMFTWKSGSPRQGLKWVEQACEVRPKLGPFHSTRGVLLAELGRTTESIDAFQTAISLAPDHLEAHHNLATAYLRTGAYESALSILQVCLTRAPNNPSIQLKTGQALLGLNLHEDANEHLQKAAAALPRHAPAWMSLGIALMKAGNTKGSQAALTRARELAPKNPSVHAAWSDLNFLKGNLEEAEVAAGKAMKFAPTNRNHKSRLGRILSTAWRLEEAQEIFSSLIQQNPHDLVAISGLAMVLHRKGDNAGAWKLLSPHIEEGQTSTKFLIAAGPIARRVGESTQAIAWIKTALDKPLAQYERALLNHILGTLLESTEDYDGAFLAHDTSNQLRELRYDANDAIKGTQKTIETFSARFFETGKHHSTQPIRNDAASPKPVFIVGMPRSGTSMVEQIIASHPAVFGAGERKEIGSSVHGLAKISNVKVPYPMAAAHVSHDDLIEIGERYQRKMAHLAQKAGHASCEIITDKMPHNFLFLGFIAQVLPEARIIHCRRDPLDTCLSCYFQYFNARNPVSTSLSSLGTFYQEYERLMAHWHEVLPIPILDIQYETCVHELEATARELISFIGLDWDPACLAFHHSNRMVATASYEQVRKPVYTTSIGKAQHYLHHLSPLLEALSR